MASALPGCVGSLQSSLSLLSSSISTLDSGVNDFPRMAKVLQTTRHFELLPESSLISAQSSLLSELTPELDSMLSRVEVYLDKLQRREASMIAKYELQAGRLSSRRKSDAAPLSENDERGTRAGTGGLDADSGRDALKLKQIRQKKDRLSYAVDRLTLQAQQKERQLRQTVKGGE